MTDTAHQPRLPGRLTHEVDEFLEEFFELHLARIPISEWDEAAGLWSTLQLADPATAKRIIAHALSLCADGHEILPRRLADAAIAHLVRPKSRNRIQDQHALAKAAAYQAQNPGASLRDIAKAVGVDHTVVRQWKKEFVYKRELVRWLIPQAQRDYQQYVDRFGSPFAAANLPEPSPMGLARLRAGVARALSENIPITDASVLKAVLEPSLDPIDGC